MSREFNPCLQFLMALNDVKPPANVLAVPYMGNLRAGVNCPLGLAVVKWRIVKARFHPHGGFRAVQFSVLTRSMASGLPGPGPRSQRSTKSS